MREERIGEGEGNLSLERFPSPSPNLSPLSKDFRPYRIPTAGFPRKNKARTKSVQALFCGSGELASRLGFRAAPPAARPVYESLGRGGMGFGGREGKPFSRRVPLPSPIFYSFPSPFPNFLTMALAGMMPVAAADTMLPDTPGPSPATKRLETDVSRSLDVATCVEKNLISGA